MAAIPPKNNLRPMTAYKRDAGFLDDVFSGMTKRLALSDGRDGGVKNLNEKKNARKR